MVNSHIYATTVADLEADYEGIVQACRRQGMGPHPGAPRKAPLRRKSSLAKG